MSMKLDNWKDIKNVDPAEKLHQQNERTREQDKSLDKRLQNAFKNFKAKPALAEKQGGKLQPRANASSPSAKSLPKSPLPNDAHLVHGPRSTVQPHSAQASAEGKKGVDQGPRISTVYPQPSDPSAAARKNMPQAASQFVVETPKPSLANLLKSTPPTPPKTEDGKQRANPNAEIFQQAREAPKVQAPMTPDAGGKLTSAAKQDSEVGKKKPGEKKEGTQRGEGKGALAASRSGSAEGGGRLEAASSGIAGGSDEPVWIADLEPLGYTVNLDRNSKNIEEVRKRADWFKKYVLRQPEAAAVVAKGVELSHQLDDLFDQVKKNIPPKNSYGVVRG